MKWHLRRLTAPMTVIGVLIFTPAASQQAAWGRQKQPGETTRRTQTADPTQSATAHRQDSTDQTQGTGRRRRRGRRGDAAGDSGTGKTRGNKLTVVRRVNQARLTAAQIKTIRSLPLLRGAVAVRGNTISALAGSSLWLLSNGNYHIISGGTAEPYYEKYEQDIGIGTMVWACLCYGIDPNTKDDGCEFVGARGSMKCEQTGGVNCTCKLEDFLITTEGGAIGFEGPPTN